MSTKSANAPIVASGASSSGSEKLFTIVEYPHTMQTVRTYFHLAVRVAHPDLVKILPQLAYEGGSPVPGPSLLDARRDPYDGDECIHRIKLRINDISQHHQQQRFCIKLTLLDAVDRPLETIFSSPIRVVSKSSLINGVRNKRGIASEPDQPLPPRQKSKMSLLTPSVPMESPSDHTGAAAVLAELSNSLHAKAMSAEQDREGHSISRGMQTPLTPLATPTTTIARPSQAAPTTPLQSLRTPMQALAPPPPMTSPALAALASPASTLPAVPFQQLDKEMGLPRTLQQDVRLLHVVCADLQSQLQRVQATISAITAKQDEIATKQDEILARLPK